MRAVYIENLAIQESYTLKDEPFHHLVNVVRLKLNERVLLLNGRGLQVECEVINISKRELFLEKRSDEAKSLPYDIDVAIGMPKKDALDLCLKQVVELGVKNCFLVKADYSQMKVPDEGRIKKQLISALEQSNSPQLTNVEIKNFSEIDYGKYDDVVILDSQGTHHSEVVRAGKYLLIVGPEGGFSPSEFEFFRELPKVNFLSLPTPIMRTPTALSCGVGLLLQRLMD